MNPIIVLAVLAQSVVARRSKVAGALAGFLITAGILLWGLTLYAAGGQIQFFGVPLSESAFLLVCAVWFMFDARAWASAKRTEQAAPPEPTISR